MIQMTLDVPGDHDGGKLPILDLKCWIETNQEGRKMILHDFYRKPMASVLPIKRKSAIPDRQKMSILVEEAMRRMRNVSPSICMKEKLRHMSRY